MPLQYRSVTADEFAEFRRIEELAFGLQPTPEEIDSARRRTDLTRTLAAFQDGAVVGTAAAISFRMTVAGGELPAAGVAHVGVSPTHRRRGVLTGLMRHQLDDLHERGEPLAALWASESLIYGRFGYGNAILHESWRIDRDHAALLDSPSQSGRIRLVEKDEARQTYPAIFDRVRAGRVGMLNMPGARWDRMLEDDERRRHGASALFHILYERDGRADGYATYRIRSDWRDGIPRNSLRVGDVMPATAEASEALWRYLFGIDLIGEVSVGTRPLDDPLPWMLQDPRRLRRSISDAIWLRLVDVPAALSGRCYATAATLRLEVRDPFCQWNDGIYRLEGGPEGGRCERTAEPPDLTLPVDALAAAYLGGVRFATLAAARRVDELRPGALAVADGLFAIQRAPWCSVFF